ALIEIISPILPAALVIGQTVAVQRLRKKGVHCVDVPRVMLAGKIQIFCFDKTGTLTKEGLDFYGLVQTEYGRDSNLENMLNLGNPSTVKELTDTLADNVKDFGALTELALGTCHSVTELDGKLIGNPVDVEMFTNTHRTIKLNESDSSKAIVSPPQDVKSNANFITDHAEVVKQFEFIHHRQSMSVVVRYPNSANSHLLHVFAKGSFEKILEKCNPGSIPANYHSIAEFYAKQGCYVLAIAHKVIDETQTAKKAVNTMLDTDENGDSGEWNRDEIECDLNLVCLILFKNLLKEDTGAAIDEIKKSNTRVVMITGDATLTGINIARKSGMINYGRRVILGDVSESEAQNRPNESPNDIQNTDTVAWTDVDTEQSVDIHELEQSGSEPYDLALTSRAFNRLHSAGKLDKSILMNTRVFGRMTPKDKVDCIKLHMKYGITAMCGDGGNDCGALRVAHVGLAMSNSEASIVSPFSTAKKSVFSCVELLSQGRGALATSFANYKFLMLYGQTMAMFKLFSMYFSSTISQSVWITIDGFITVGMSLSISLSKPVEKLANIRPTARLFGPTTMLSTVGQVVINWIFMVVCFIILYRQPWYRCHELDASTIDFKQWWLLGDNYEAMTMGIIIMFQFVNSGFIYNFGYKFRRFWFRNYVLVIIYLAFISLLTVIVLLPPNALGCIYRMNCGDKDVLQELGYKPPKPYIEPYNIPQGNNVYPTKFRWFMWIFCFVNMIVGILWEVLVVIGPIGAYFSKRHGKKNYYQ
ncbi:putative cation-transporting ATPase 13A4, partial [Zancudomyces culisetae]